MSGEPQAQRVWVRTSERAIRGRAGKKLFDLLPGHGDDRRGSVAELLDLSLWRDAAGKAFSGYASQPNSDDSEENVDTHLVLQSWRMNTGFRTGGLRYRL